MVSGIAIVDKPRGMTSHDVVGRARRALRTREIGHAGTLDPMATGVLVLGVGEGTKLLTFLTAADKAYEATLALGTSTDSLDADGATDATVPVPPEVLAELEILSREGRLGPRLLEAVHVELGRTSQVPPSYSAIHVDGERAHTLARRGELVALPARPVTVHTLEVVSDAGGEHPTLSLRVCADKGYYVRSLARDLALALGTVGHLTSLRRTRSGCFDANEAVPLADLANLPLVPLAEAARRALPSVVLDDARARDARHGKRIAPEHLGALAKGPTTWLDLEGALVAVGERTEDGEGKVLRGFGPR